MELFFSYITTIVIVIYIIGFAATIDMDTTLYNWRNGRASSYNRKAIPKDAWKASIWPLRLSIAMIKIILDIIHNILSVALLLFFISYKYSNTYKKINTYLNK